MAAAIQLSAHRDFCVLFDQPLTQPASSDPGQLIAECFLIDVSDPALCTVVQLVSPGALDPGELITEYFLFHVSDSALCTGGHLVRPGAVLIVSCRAGDGDGCYRQPMRGY